MPRINNTDYRNRRATLLADWQKRGALLALLTPEQHEALRTLYLFDTPLRSADFAAARAEAVKRDPDLIRRAGLAYRAFAKLKTRRQPGVTQSPPSTALAPVRPRTPVTRTSTRRITALSEVNPDVDPEQIARIIIAMAQQQARGRRTRDNSGL